MTKHRDLKRLDISPGLYDEFRSLLREELAKDSTFCASYLAQEFESKLLDPNYSDPPDVRRARAIEKWLACEDRNRVTNSRLMHTDDSDFLFLSDEGFPVTALDVISRARHFIREVLGASVPEDALRGSFSGGASTNIKRGVGTIARKYLLGTHITEGAIWHFLRLTKSTVWAPRDFTITRGNVMFTVPKTSLIDRCACKEPDYNMYAQKAVGDYIRQRLRRVGVNLNDQTLNQRLAQEGSREGNLATVDLSSASDSVTTQLVLMLLPDEWYYLMDDLRSKETMIDGHWHLNEMFSSMGNAFTFELESLIFWALTRACSYLTRTTGKISVYGDDIICPVGLEESLIATLEFCGFTVNTKKSFFSGPFRESCGKHWFKGLDVTPFYVRKVPVDVSDWCHLLNSLRRWAGNVGHGVICDPQYFDLWSLFADEIPKPLWGEKDLASRRALCSRGRSPIAHCVRKLARNGAKERELSSGAYLHWLDASKDRLAVTELETSVFTTEGPLVLRRCGNTIATGIPEFPQELGQ